MSRPERPSRPRRRGEEKGKVEPAVERKTLPTGGVELGPPLRRSAEEIKRLSKVNVADQMDAAELWRLLAPFEWKGLLDATVERKGGKS